MVVAIMWWWWVDESRFREPEEEYARGRRGERAGAPPVAKKGRSYKRAGGLDDGHQTPPT